MNIPITIRQIDSRVPTKIFIFVIQKFTLKFYDFGKTFTKFLSNNNTLPLFFS